MNIKNIEKHKYKKGQSGNPNGRPKGKKSLSTLLKKYLKARIDFRNPIKQNKEDKKAISDIIAMRLLFKAINGDIVAIKEIMDRTEGKVLDKRELTGANGKDLMPPTIVVSGIDE